MRLNQNLGMILLAVFLILFGISGLGLFSIKVLGTITALCALASGILLLINR